MQRRHTRDMRTSRFAILFSAIAGFDFGLGGPGGHGVFFAEDPDAGGGPGGTPPTPPTGAPVNTPPPPTPGTPPPPTKKTYTKVEFDHATSERDRERKLRRKVLQILGVDADDLDIEWGEDGEPVITGLEDLQSKLTAGVSATDPAAQEAARKKIVKPLEKQIAALTNENKALRQLVEDVAIVQPLREAARLEQAVDDDGGQFTDLVELLRKRFRPVIVVDQATQRATCEIQTLDAEGKELHDADGDPLKPRDVVKGFLDAKPKYRSASYRPGPGAGGAGSNGNAGGAAVQQSSEDRARRQADAIEKMYGVRPRNAPPKAATA